MPSLVEISPMILKKIYQIFLIQLYLPSEKDTILYLNKLESPLPKDALYQVLLKLKLAPWLNRCVKFKEIGRKHKQMYVENYNLIS